MTQASTRLTWLHISDIHLREKTGWAQDIVLSKMLEDITNRYGTKRPDLVFVTGDIAFSGNAKEYELAEEFLKKLCERISLPKEHLFLIPGNHDIDRELEEDAFLGARSSLLAMTDVDKFFEKEGRRRTIFARQLAFRKFANRLAPAPIYSESSYCHCRIVSIGAIRVRVFLVDSTWLSEGGEHDATKLLVGERQVLDLTKIGSPQGDTLTFALMHHPFSWLREFEQVAIENLIIEHADLCLRGHVHVPDQRASETLQGRIAIFTAGAAFETRTSHNSYLWCSLDLATGGGEKVTHRYIHHDKRWEASEPQPWTLLSAPPSVDLGDAIRLVEDQCQYPNYTACVLAGLTSDVPIRLGAQECFVSASASIPGSTHEVGEIVQRLRFHLHWRGVWEPSGWQSTFALMVEELDQRLRSFSQLAQDLVKKEIATKDIVAALDPGRVVVVQVAQVRDEVDALLADEDLARAREVMDRWLSQSFLELPDRLEILRLDVKVLLAEGHSAKALAAADKILAMGRAATDLALTAICAHRAGQPARAASLMHDALDAGIDKEQVKATALRIAGASGDSSLVERVRL